MYVCIIIIIIIIIIITLLYVCRAACTQYVLTQCVYDAMYVIMCSKFS
jgi:hypothetical protein